MHKRIADLYQERHEAALKLLDKLGTSRDTDAEVRLAKALVEVVNTFHETNNATVRDTLFALAAVATSHSMTTPDPMTNVMVFCMLHANTVAALLMENEETRH